MSPNSMDDLYSDSGSPISLRYPGSLAQFRAGMRRLFWPSSLYDIDGWPILCYENRPGDPAYASWSVVPELEQLKTQMYMGSLDPSVVESQRGKRAQIEVFENAGGQSCIVDFWNDVNSPFPDLFIGEPMLGLAGFFSMVIAVLWPEGSREGEGYRPKRSSERPDWFPKKGKTIKKWHEAYKVISQMREEAREPDDWGDDTEPRLGDYRDRLRTTVNWAPSERTVSRIIVAGDKGWLK